ncbi:hypothetical protein EUV02_04035 [Polymorphobacter arshaanensis]|uniref:Uncharacterized protein n=1 Tax=Glacieibacterium arshaanense TaxID=2511025 RepID=A0A4Y9ESK2_9SPHN|nr:hypothetical protein [Polymorphobacter arshaanensis]TFU06189.1 hypothetical protein EUV02_04035 [Polymorphobacter arshaanensis]
MTDEIDLDEDAVAAWLAVHGDAMESIIAEIISTEGSTPYELDCGERPLVNFLAVQLPPYPGTHMIDDLFSLSGQTIHCVRSIPELAGPSVLGRRERATIRSRIC